MLQPIYIKFCQYYVKKSEVDLFEYETSLHKDNRSSTKKMLPTNINKECAQINFKSLAIFIRLSDIAYQNIMFIKKL